MASPIATAFVDVRADFSKFGPDIIAQAEQAGNTAGQSLTTKFRKAGESSGTGFVSGLRSSIGQVTVISGAFTALFGALARGGLEADESQARLRATIEGNGKSYATYASQINDAIDKSHKFGVTTSQARDAVSQLSARFSDPIQALHAYDLALTLNAGQHISWGLAVARATGIAAGLPRTLRLYGLTVTGTAKAQAELTKASNAHASAMTKLDSATQHLSDVEAVIAERHAKSASSASGVAAAEKNLAQAREEHAQTSAKDLATAEQNLLDLEARLNEQTKTSTTDTRRLRDAQEALAKAFQVHDREAYAKALQDVADAQQDISDHSKLSVADQQQLRDAQQAVTDARTEAASQGKQVIAAEDALTQARKDGAATAGGSVEENISLRDAHKAVADAQAEATKTAADLAKAQTDSAHAQGEINGAIDTLLKRFGPAADKAINSTIGKYHGLTAVIKSTRDELAKRFGPALTIVSGGFTLFGASASIVQAVLAVHTARMAAAAVATHAKTAADIADAGVMTGTVVPAEVAVDAAGAPLLLTFAAIAAVALAVYLAFKNWDKIKAVVSDVFGFVKQFIGDAVKWIGDRIGEFGQLFLVLSGPLGWLTLFIIDHFETIKNGIASAIHWVSDKIGDLIGVFSGIGDKIKNAAGDVFGFFEDAFKNAVRGLITLWNRLDLKVPKVHVPGTNVDIGGFDLFPDLPVPFAKGGITSGPLLALLGDNPSGREAVIPLDSAAARDALGSSVVFGPGSVVVTFEGVIPTEQQAHAVGVAVGRGAADEMAKLAIRRAQRVA